MGQMKDQCLCSKEGTLKAESKSRPFPPPLPPRQPQYSHSLSPVQAQDSSAINRDPRSSSTESLIPESNQGSRRELLLIYVHGFMGNETSFKSFPAHVHNVLVPTLSATHVVHTKVYPRYKSRKPIRFARDDFSKWLAPHESSSTDVVLLGHSMGGLLAADVALMMPGTAESSLPVHIILGVVNFDVPFLGMHPGVISAGLGSLFKPKAKPSRPPASEKDGKPPVASQSIASFDLESSESTPQNAKTSEPQSPSQAGYFTQGPPQGDRLSPTSTSASVTSPLSVPVDDPNFNPSFQNDIVLPVRKGWDNTMHFFNKHSDNLIKASKKYVVSHREFGGARGDYRGLRNRYSNLRALEDLPSKRPSGIQRSTRPRLRFVNYYTVSTGYAKAESDASRSGSPQPSLMTPQTTHGTSLEVPQSTTSEASIKSRSRSPRISIEDPAGGHITDPALEEEPLAVEESQTDGALQSSSNPPDHIDRSNPSPTMESEPLTSTTDARLFSLDNASPHPTSSRPSPSPEAQAYIPGEVFPSELPELPVWPGDLPGFDPNQYRDKEITKLAKKDWKRRKSMVDQAKKDFKRAIKEREKYLKRQEQRIQKLEQVETGGVKVGDLEKQRVRLSFEKSILEQAKQETSGRVKHRSSGRRSRSGERLSQSLDRVQEPVRNSRSLSRDRKNERGGNDVLCGRRRGSPRSQVPNDAYEIPEAKQRNTHRSVQELKDSNRGSGDLSQEGFSGSPADGCYEPQATATKLSSSLGPRNSESLSPARTPLSQGVSKTLGREADPKPPRERKFCVVPKRDPNGNRDPSWVKVYMVNTDEVGAHCGLFDMERPHYQSFVQEIAARIELWVQER